MGMVSFRSTLTLISEVIKVVFCMYGILAFRKYLLSK
jgi:hypothetical protein